MNRAHVSARIAPGVLVAVACLFAAMIGLAAPDVAAEPPERDAGADAATADVPAPVTGGLAALPEGAASGEQPSDAIFPPQEIPLRFDHARHVSGLGLSCTDCHPQATTSEDAKDRLLPAPNACDRCHDVDHRDPLHVKTLSGAKDRCELCHSEIASDGRPRRVVIPPANLRFSHAAHARRNVGCGQCHGDVARVGLATREQLPRMQGCLRCHQLDGESGGDAKGECSTCHLTAPSGVLRTSFASGKLEPPAWMRNAAHTADFIETHKRAAASDSAFCGNCHVESECTECHDGRVRPRQVHPNDWISMHAAASVLDEPRCTNCHQMQTFCADCHRRLGLSRDSASGNRQTGRRFHPPPSEWTLAPRGPGHHAWEAMRNLNECVACHTERDCGTCHATRGMAGGMGVSPHGAGFRAQCRSAMRSNARSCMVCHEPGDRSLEVCR